MVRQLAMLWIGVWGLAGAASAQDLPAQPFPLKWSAVTGAGSYLVEVKDADGALVISQQYPSEKNSATLSLVPGPYALKITTLNRLNRPESDTGWVPLLVPASAPPVVGSLGRGTFEPGTAPSLDVPVSGLARDATVSLIFPSGRKVPMTLAVPDGVAHLSLPVLAERGEYSLLFTNPPNLSATVRGKISVHYPVPVVEATDPSSLTPSKFVQVLKVRGKDFSQEAVVALQAANGDQVELVVRERTPTELAVLIPPSAPPQTYRVVVANAADELPVVGPSLALAVSPGDQKISEPATLVGRLRLTAQGYPVRQGSPPNGTYLSGIEVTVVDLSDPSRTIRVATGAQGLFVAEVVPGHRVQIGAVRYSFEKGAAKGKAPDLRAVDAVAALWSDEIAGGTYVLGTIEWTSQGQQARPNRLRLVEDRAEVEAAYRASQATKEPN